MNKYFHWTLLLSSISSLSCLTVAIAKEQASFNYDLDLTDLESLSEELPPASPPITNEEIALLPVTFTGVHQELNAIAEVSLVTAVLEGKFPVANKPEKSVATSPLVADTTVAIVKEFEGFRSDAYLDTDGTPVIGYGQSRIAGNKVQLGDRIAYEVADRALKAELEVIQAELLTVINVELNDNQLGAITSLAFNTGVHAIKESTLVKKLNQKDYLGAANEFTRWDRANIRGRLQRMPGLTRRRNEERQLFLTPDNSPLTTIQEA